MPCVLYRKASVNDCSYIHTILFKYIHLYCARFHHYYWYGINYSHIYIHITMVSTHTNGFYKHYHKQLLIPNRIQTERVCNGNSALIITYNLQPQSPNTSKLLL